MLSLKSYSSCNTVLCVRLISTYDLNCSQVEVKSNTLTKLQQGKLKTSVQGRSVISMIYVSFLEDAYKIKRREELQILPGFDQLHIPF